MPMVCLCAPETPKDPATQGRRQEGKREGDMRKESDLSESEAGTNSPIPT